MGSLERKIMKRTNIKKITKGNIALTPPIISTKGVWDHLEISAEETFWIVEAEAIISSTEIF